MTTLRFSRVSPGYRSTHVFFICTFSLYLLWLYSLARIPVSFLAILEAVCARRASALRLSAESRHVQEAAEHELKACPTYTLV